MKQIAFFQTDLRVGGVQKSLVNILNDIDFSRCCVDVYLFDDQCFFDLPAHENLHIKYLTPPPGFFRVLYFGLTQVLLGDVTGGRRYDVAVDFNSYQNECAAGVINANAKKRVMWIHNDVEVKRKNEPKYRILWHFFKGKLRHYDEFVAVSPGIIDGFRRVSGIQDKPITAIPNHIDTGEIFRKAKLDVDFSVDPAKLNLCSVGRICHQKGYDLLMGYLAQVKQSRTDFHFYLIGDGPAGRRWRGRSGSWGWRGLSPCWATRPTPSAIWTRWTVLSSPPATRARAWLSGRQKALGLPLYISKNLEPYNPGVTGCGDMVQALLAAQNPRKRFTTTCQITTPKSPGAPTPYWGCDGRRGSEERQRYGPTRFTI